MSVNPLNLRECESFKSMHSLVVGVFLLAALMMAGGCSRSYDSMGAIEKLNATNPQRLATLYRMYQTHHGGKGPANEKDFRKYISSIGPNLLARIKVEPDNLDPLFLSDRDGQPLVIKWKRLGNDRSPPEPVIFEKEGVDGKRIVAFTGNKFEEIEDQSAYQQLLDKK